MPSNAVNKREQLTEALKQRILILDGAMGTMIQQLGLEEADFRGARFADWPQDVKGNNDLLSLTLPDAIADIHNTFLTAGADILETNSFNANRISQAGRRPFIQGITVLSSREVGVSDSKRMSLW